MPPFSFVWIARGDFGTLLRVPCPLFNPDFNGLSCAVGGRKVSWKMTDTQKSLTARSKEPKKGRHEESFENAKAGLLLTYVPEFG
jgi:hypothetical protein